MPSRVYPPGLLALGHLAAGLALVSTTPRQELAWVLGLVVVAVGSAGLAWALWQVSLGRGGELAQVAWRRRAPRRAAVPVFAPAATILGLPRSWPAWPAVFDPLQEALVAAVQARARQTAVRVFQRPHRPSLCLLGNLPDARTLLAGLLAAAATATDDQEVRLFLEPSQTQATVLVGAALGTAVNGRVPQDWEEAHPGPLHDRLADSLVVGDLPAVIPAEGYTLHGVRVQAVGLPAPRYEGALVVSPSLALAQALVALGPGPVTHYPTTRAFRDAVEAWPALVAPLGLLVFVEVDCLDGDGHDVCTMLRRLGAPGRVIATVSSTDRVSPRHLACVGFDGVVVTPPGTPLLHSESLGALVQALCAVTASAALAALPAPLSTTATASAPCSACPL